MKKLLRALGKNFGSLKAAVTLIFSLALVLACGTFFESFYSRLYAYNLVYGSLWFQALLLFLGVNILAAALLRLPFQKRLAGFYISHVGLLLLLAGSLLTLIFGIDGTITLPPGQPSKTVRLEEPVLYVQVDGTLQQAALPRSVFPQEMRQVVKGKNQQITIRRFLPYAIEKPDYRKTEPINGSGVQFTLFAPRASTRAVLSSPPSSYPEQVQLGPLKVVLLGNLGKNCTLPPIPPEEPWLFLDGENCFLLHTPSDKGVDLLPGLHLSALNLLQANPNFRLESRQGPDLLIPGVSAWPLQENKLIPGPAGITPNFSSPYRLYSTAEVFAGPGLVFFNQNQKLHLAIYNPPAAATIVEMTGQMVELPWMKLRLALDSANGEGLPYRSFVPVEPNPGDKDHLSAVAIEVDGSIYWLASNGEPAHIPIAGNFIEAFLGFRTFELPWGFTLERFKMDTDPGTQNPASYESFVNVRTPGFQTPENAHIYMNNPLKKGRYTFYQASYFQTGGDSFGSVLQVNYDPGRYVKYAGSLTLVVGTLLHFYLRRTRRAQN